MEGGNSMKSNLIDAHFAEKREQSMRQFREEHPKHRGRTQPLPTMNPAMSAILTSVCAGPIWEETRGLVLGRDDHPKTEELRKQFAIACLKVNFTVADVARVLRRSEAQVRRMAGVGEGEE